MNFRSSIYVLFALNNTSLSIDLVQNTNHVPAHTIPVTDPSSDILHPDRLFNLYPTSSNTSLTLGIQRSL
ncbi:hypothetical protein QCA50_010425 [Cerrena zonata]|uniref:Uncharacterized protein n=1 Tax=Cerrena zonata TaxID=2478898 RepID=A0AAW0FYG0_9APHY